jgi:hypothetical protein
MTTLDDLFWGNEQNWTNFLASGAFDGIGFTAVYASDSPVFSLGAGFQGWFYGVLSCGGDPSPDGTTGPAVNDYSNFAGVWGTGTYVTGVAGTSINNCGVYGQTEQDPGSSIPRVIQAGVFGAANTGPGVVGWSTTWNGVEGWAYQGTAVLGVSETGYGVQGASTWQPGVLGASDNDAGVYGLSDPEQLEGPTVNNPVTTASVVGTSNSRHGVIGTTNEAIAIFGVSTNGWGIVGVTSNPNGYAGAFYGNAMVTGTLTASVKNGVVKFPDGTQRLLHCMESPEHWFEDFGSAKLARGRAVVKFDADFAKVIRSGDYHVFVTPEGDCRGIYVRRKSANRFEVREVTNGKSSIEFSYRIVGRRKDIKGHRRFAKFDMPVPPPAPRARRPSLTRAAFIAELEREARARATPSMRRSDREVAAMPTARLIPGRRPPARRR